MSTLSNETRAAAKAKVNRLMQSDPHQKVDASNWTEAEPMNGDVQTGMRVLSRRAFKSGGAVQGRATGGRADRKPRASGGGLSAASLINRNVKTANEDRDGTKHIGGLKRGGRLARREGGRTDDMVGAAMKATAEKGYDPYNSQPSLAKTYKKMTGVVLPTKQPDATGRLVGSAMKMAQKQGVDPRNSQPSQAKAYDKLWKLRGGRKHGGRTHKDMGGLALPSWSAAVARANGGPVDDKPMPKPVPAGAPQGYDPIAVNKAIASSNRSGQRIGGKEAAKIHALLKGRYKDGGKVHAAGCKCAKCCSGGRIGKAKGGSINDGTRPAGGRIARKEGGRAKKAMNVNIIIAPPTPKPSMAPPMMPPGAGGPPGLHQGAPPAPMAPAGAGAPMGPPPGGVAPPPQMRKAGGRTYPIESGGGGGLGRLEKIKAYGKQ